jgi:uncharacterized protein (DUF3820 family)
MLGDNDLFPFGNTHNDKKMANVPEDYLLWFWGENCEEYRAGKMPSGDKKDVMMYIDDFFGDQLP